MIQVSSIDHVVTEAVMVRSIPRPVRANTLDLPAVPRWLQSLILLFLAPILAWAELRILRAILPHWTHHPLVQLGQWYDPAPVVTACAAYRAPAGPGAPPTYTLEQLVRAEIARAWAESGSDRDLEWHLSSNVVVRWFVGLSLFQPVPDHTTRNDFHQWMSTHAPAVFFRDVLTFLGRVDPEDAGTTPQIVDTFAMESPAAWSPRVANLLLDLCADLRAAWERHAPRALQRALPPLDRGPIRRPMRPRDAVERQALLVQAVRLSQWLLAGCTPVQPQLPPPARAAIDPLLAALTKVLADEIAFDATDYPTERPPRKKGSYRIISATDSEATFRHHDDDLTLGYNVAIATTATRIRAVVALTGATPDSQAPSALLQQQQAAGQALPPFVIMDRAGGWGKCRARVDVGSGGHPTMVALIPPAGGTEPGRFGPQDFRVDAERTTCTCPNQVVSTRAYASGDGEGKHFRYLASDCRGCALWEPCRGKDGNPNGHRSVCMSDYQPYLRRADAFNATKEGQALLGQRWRVEPTIAWLVQYQGCRRARRVGRDAAQFQLYQACAVRNLLLWLNRVQRREAPRPVRS
jgi:hypothetical protein